MTKKDKKEFAAKPVEFIDGVVTRHAMASYQLAKRRAQLEKKLAEMREEFGKEIPDLENEIAAINEQLCAWMDGNRVLLGDRKSLNFTNGKIGIRDNPPAIGIVPGLNAEDVIRELSTMQDGDVFVRSGKPALDKDRIKASWDQYVTLFEKIGLVLKRSEMFFVEPKSEPETAAAVAA